MMLEADTIAPPATTFYDRKGRSLEMCPDLPGPHFLGVAPPKSKFFLARDLCHPDNLADDDMLKSALFLAATHMAQSPTGRAALAMMEREDIRLGLDGTLPPGQTLIGSDPEGYYIMLSPAGKIETHHLAIIYSVAQIAAITRILEGIDELAYQSIDGILARTMRISGVAAMMNHGEECIAAQKDYQRRFVPPELQAILNDFLQTPSLKALDVPKDRAERDRLEAHLLVAARAALDPLSELKASPRGAATGLNDMPSRT